MIFILILRPHNPEDIIAIHAYDTRSSFKNNMYIKKNNIEKLRQAVLIFGAKLWNEIPGRMRDMCKRKLIYY